MKVLSFLFAVALATPCFAADLSDFGLSQVQEITATEGAEIRGQGMSTYVNSLATQSFALSLADKATGSVINLNSNSQTLSYDGVDLFAGSSGASQAVGAVAQAGIQLGDATFEMGEFNFALTGFNSVSQATLAAGPSGAFDLSSMFGGN